MLSRRRLLSWLLVLAAVPGVAAAPSPFFDDGTDIEDRCR